MKARSGSMDLLGTATMLIVAVLTVGVSAVWASSTDGATVKIRLAPKSKLDLLKEMVTSTSRPRSHLPKALLPSCKGGWPSQASVQYSQFAEIEVTVTDRVSLRRLRSYPLAPGSQFELLDGGQRVRAQLPAPIVGDLIEEGADVKVLRDFMLWEKSDGQSNTAKDRLTAAAATCPVTYRQGSNGTNYSIPEGSWTYSDIQISGAPSNAQVACVDVHYEIIHPYSGDVVVDLTDEDMTYEYHLHASNESDSSRNINQTVTGITLFAGKDSGYLYGPEGVNQLWTLWATDEYTGDTGYIDTWWIKVYYTVPTSGPSNDDCSKAVTITNGTPYSGTTIGATGTYQTQCGFYDYLDVWHVFTPTQTGLVTITAQPIETAGHQPFDTTLAVFDGCGGTELACNNNECTTDPNSMITIRMLSGKTYYIRVAGYDYRTGDYTLTVQQQALDTLGTPSAPAPSNGATSVETHAVLSWNDSASLVEALNVAKSLPKTRAEESPEPKVIYGKDNRLEEYQITNSAFRHAGDSTVMIAYRTDLTDNGDGTYTLASKTFAEWYQTIDPLGTGNPLCNDEPFRNQPAPGICSGVLVAPDIIATAGHCVACETISNLVVVFGFVMQNASTAKLIISAADVYGCSQVIAYQDGHPDWALIRLDRNVTTHVPLDLRRAGKIADAQPLLAVGHPWGVPRKYDAGGIVRDNTGQTFFQANVDAYMGSSGSPIFNQDSLEIEGVVSTGKQDFVTDPSGTCDRSYVCADTGCPDWEDITRATAFGDVVPSFDVYLGTSQGSLQLVNAYSPAPWFNPGVLQVSTTYYWKIVARNAWTEVSGPTWSFRTVASSIYKPVYRFWSPTNSVHFYTISPSEKNKIRATYPSSVWMYEGIVYYAFDASGQPNSSPIYRFWSPKFGSHFYTISESEKDKLVADYLPDVWTYEGIAFYAYPPGQQPAGTRPVYRFYSPKTGDHFFTIQESEKDKLVNALSASWTYESIAWYAYE